MENQELIKQVTEKAEKWLTPAYDAETQAEVKRMLENPDKTELIDSFYKDLEFGTGGLRGIMGAGTNRMNIYTVGAATQGLSNYLNKCFAGKKDISVVVGHDCRNNSDKFAKISADIFSANGIKVYLFDDLRPTPEVSFAIRHFGCQSGINITASHNPREYNGYKAYWDDGAQVLAPHDTAIIDEVNKVTVADIKFNGNKDLIQIIGKEVDKVYLEMVHSISIDPEVIRRQKDLSIVYTPLHGAGRVLIPDSLKEWGFENINCVPEQMVKDGNFPTVVSPNPENAEALSMAIALAKKIDADIVMASDPDADRVGMACKDDKGEWVLINGNQTCLIFLYYIIKNRIAMGKMQPNDFIVKTIVTTELIKAVADKNKIEMRDCYTGFKWIAREIRLSEGKQQYIGGGEESYGFLAEDFVRDKDAVSATVALCEAAAYYATKGKTLWDVMIDMYEKYGYCVDSITAMDFPGLEGMDKMKAMLANLRENPLKDIAGYKVLKIRDYSKDTVLDVESGNVEPTGLPASDVLYYELEGGAWVCVRPSGTEPKIKFYYGVKASSMDEAQVESAKFAEWAKAQA